MQSGARTGLAALLAIALALGLAAASSGPALHLARAQGSTVTVTVEEAVFVSDGPTLVPAAGVHVDESVGITDSPGVFPPAMVSVEEAVGVSDDPRLVPPAVVDVAESILVSDGPEPTTGATGGGATIAGAPSISAFSPTSAAVGASITITGSAFTGATALKFNAITATFTVDSATQITATVPADATTGTVSVTTSGGTGTSASSFGVPPRITGFSPTGGAPGTTVTITGDTFGGATAVTFNGLGATFTADSATQVTATVPANATTGAIGVSTSAGAATSSASFTVVPRITSFSPIGGGPGTSVTITGANFSGATAVGFGGLNATFTVNSAAQITATVPARATTGAIRVTTSAGTATSANSFLVTTRPIISSFSPIGAPVGSTVTISGANFSGATAVTFNGLRATFTVRSAQQITATVPLRATAGPIAVTTSIGTATSATSFTVTTGAVLGEFEERLSAPGELERMPEPSMEAPPFVSAPEMEAEMTPAEEPLPEMPPAAEDELD